MSNNNRPQGRKRNISGQGNGVNRRQGSGGGGGVRATTLSIPAVILAVVVYLLFGGGGSDTTTSNAYTSSTNTNNYVTYESNTSTLNTEVLEGSRDKYTTILGDGQDQVTVMVYMCGADLESRSGMATNDLTEMTKATLSDNVNVIVLTGGASSWKNNVVSSSVNQIYQVVEGGLKTLEEDYGNASMTSPSTLTSFITYCAENYAANRYELIFWDHGGGSVSGYGYDENHKNSGSMGLSGIDTALKNAGVQFDFIGFDACLMATTENALMLNKYADYLIASEETEPGIGWYYTNWLTTLSSNPSTPTIEIGKEIVDDFVETCASRASGQKTTLSVTDLAELSTAIPDKFRDFSVSIRELIDEDQYQTVSTARNQSREFAQSSKIDQVDLVNFAENMNNEEGEALSAAIRSAVKYNRTSSNMTNANGLSIYFPLRNTKYVDSMSATYESIDMDDEYTSCIREFASISAAGQATGSSSAYNSLFSDFAGSYSSSSNSDVVEQLLNAFFTGNRSMVQGLDESNSSFLDESAIDYVARNHINVNNLAWDEDEKIVLSEEEWSLITNLDLNLFYDDGNGYIDLGLDNVYDFDDAGNLIADAGDNWISINNQPVAYYHLDTTTVGDTYTITGRVPCLLNGDEANLILVFDSNNEDGYIAGASYDYSDDSDVETIAKNVVELNEGDTLDFLCSYYDYDGNFQNRYFLGDTMEVTDTMVISNTRFSGTTIVTYQFTDIYNATYWSEKIIREN